MSHVWRAMCLLLLFGLSACASAPYARRSWELLGQREVDFHTDHDVIEVGRSEGTFHELRFVSRGGAVELYNVKFVLGDGEVFDSPERMVLDRGEGRTMDLPGNRRVVRRVEFVYRSLHAGGRRAVVSLYGR
jgi:hypothetical protein